MSRAQRGAEQRRWVRGRLPTSQPLIMPPKAKCPSSLLNSSPSRFFKEPSHSFLPFRFHFAFQKGELSRRDQRRNIKPSPLSLTSPASLLPSFLRDCRESGARAISLQKGGKKRKKNLRMPRVNSNNRIRDSFGRHTSVHFLWRLL